jgi:signal transduction histidine kinase
MYIKEGNYVQIMIIDTGRGSGLAMASVYDIVREHGGTIDVTSKLSQGSTFTIFIQESTKK